MLESVNTRGLAQKSILMVLSFCSYTVARKYMHLRFCTSDLYSLTMLFLVRILFVFKPLDIRFVVLINLFVG